MRLRRLFAILFIFIGLAAALANYLVLALIIGAGGILLIIIIRLLADLYWWGKDKDQW